MSARRDWAWRWAPSFALRLSVRFDAPPMSPRAWLEQRGDVPYVQSAEHANRWVGPERLERSEVLDLSEKEFTFLRSYLTPPPQVVAFDADVLDALIRGALGAFSWTLTDDDYAEPLGAGDDAASLAFFLEAPREEVEAHCRVLFTPLVVDASTARDVDELLAMVRVAIDRWHETHAAHEHPRVLEVKSPKYIPFDWWPRLDRPRVVTARVTYV